jgi:hypothetical protein
VYGPKSPLLIGVLGSPKNLGQVSIGSKSVSLVLVGADTNRVEPMDSKVLTPEVAKWRFEAAVTDFRRWAADNRYPAEGSGEWETDYEYWPELISAYCDVLDAAPPNTWDQSLVDLLLYALARDNECEVLIDELLSRPTHLFALAHAAPLSTEVHAKWQIANALGSVNAKGEDVELMIESFLGDADEYVSRRALMALTRRGSMKLDSWAVRAWNTGNEYQRMVALEAFVANDSPLLRSHLDLAEADGRLHLGRLARELRNRLAQVH